MDNKEFIPISKPSITSLEQEMVGEAVRSGWVSSLGKYIDLFESGFAEFCETEYAVSTANGTVAIHLALEAAGIGQGDEVIVPDLSFIATVNAVLYTGATPVFVDIDPYNLCMDPALIEPAITDRTRAIIPVHLYGHPADMPAIMRIAEKHGLFVIEDAAEAHGARINGKPVGGFGHCATFSFYGNKLLTTGEGGMVTTNDGDLDHRMRRLRDHAMSPEKRYWHDTLGYNYRMTNLQAALGVAQLQRSSELLEKRQLIFEWYQEELSEIGRIRLNRTYSWATNSYWLLCMECDDFTEEVRLNFMNALREQGVDSRPYFFAMSNMPYIKAEVNTPVTKLISKQGVNLPTFYDISRHEVARISSAVHASLKSLI